VDELLGFFIDVHQAHEMMHVVLCQQCDKAAGCAASGSNFSD
jgi:hypothetical protein